MRYPGRPPIPTVSWVRSIEHADGDKRQRRTPRPRRVSTVGIVSMLAISSLGAAPAAAMRPEDNRGQHGWHAPSDRLADVEIEDAECVQTSDGIRVRVKVRAVMWARGARVREFEMKAQLVPAGGSGHAWGSPARRSSPISSNRVSRTLAARTNEMALLDSEGGRYDYDIRFRLKFDRLGRGDYVYHSISPFDEPSCDDLLT